MRTILRDNYNPEVGDYHESLVVDEVNEKIWLFDCDGIFTRVSSPKVVSEFGDSEEFAASQKLVTEAHDDLTTEVAERKSADNDIWTEVGIINGKIEALATDFSYKGSVQDYAHLPSDAATGDVYTTTDTGIIYVWDGNAWVALNEYPDVFVGTDGTNPGVAGLVPAPTVTDVNKVLGADGTWVTSDPFKTVGPADYGTTGAVEYWNLPKGLYKAYNPNGNYVLVQAYKYDMYAGSEGVARHALQNGAYIIVGTNDTNGAKNVIEVGNGILQFYNTSSSGYKTVPLSDLQESAVIRGDMVKDVLDSTTQRLPLSAKQGKILNDKIEGRIIVLGGTPSTSTVGKKGQLLEDVINGRLFICTAVTPQGTDPETYTYTWEEVATSTSVPTVVQTTGTSTTDVMSQNATTGMVYADPSTKEIVAITNASGAKGARSVSIGRSAYAGSTDAIAIGNNSNAGVYGYSVALGTNSGVSARNGIAIGNSCYSQADSGIAIGAGSRASYRGSIGLGAEAQPSAQGELAIGTGTTSYGYNNTLYRLISGVHDPVNAHDAATKGYVDTQVSAIGAGTRKATNNGWDTSAPLNYIIQQSADGAMGAMFYAGKDLTDMPTYTGIGIDADDARPEPIPYLLRQTTTDDGQGSTAGHTTSGYRLALHSEISAIETRLGGLSFVALTQAEYDALATKDPNTLYVIKAA